ncbi:MAG: translation initiation factor [Myxococcales bacterium]|nr:translation initiation factor [Myxococcales bacterium]
MMVIMSGKNDPGFGALAGLRDLLPSAPAAPAAPTAPAAVAKGPARAVVRLERKGRGGKEATIVEKLGLAPDELARWCKELKSALGCGGVVEGDAIVLQGDLRSRLEAVLIRRGVRKVTISG